MFNGDTMFEKCWQSITSFFLGLAQAQYSNQVAAIATVMSKFQNPEHKKFIKEWSYRMNNCEDTDDWDAIEKTLAMRFKSLSIGLRALHMIMQDFHYTPEQSIVLIKSLCCQGDNGALLSKIIEQWLMLSQLDNFDDTSVPIQDSTLISTRKKQLITDVQMTLITKCLPLAIDINELEDVLVESVLYKKNESFADSLMEAGQVKQFDKLVQEDQAAAAEKEEEVEEEEVEDKETAQLIIPAQPRKNRDQSKRKLAYHY